MPMITHTAESLAAAAAQAFRAALPIANEQGIGVVVVVVDAGERVHYQTNLGPTVTAGMLCRAAGLFDKGEPKGVAGGQATTVGGNAGSSSTLSSAPVWDGQPRAGGSQAPAPDEPAAAAPPPGDALDLDAMNRGRAARGMPPLTREQLDARLASLPAPGDE